MVEPASHSVSTSSKRIFNPAGMVRSPSILSRLLGRLFFHRVFFDDIAANRLKDLGSQGKVVYLMNSHSLLDYMYFQWAYPRHDVQLAGYANGVNLLDAIALRPFLQILGFLFSWVFGRSRLPKPSDRMLERTLKKDGAVLLFMRPARGVLPTSGQEHSDIFERLIRMQRESKTPIFLIPQFLLWKRSTDRYSRSFVDMVFGHSDAPGRLRKLINFVVNHRRASVHVGDAVNLRDWIAENEALAVAQSEGLADKVRWRLHRQFALEYRVLKGPVVKRAGRICKEVLKNPELEEEVKQLATELNQSPEQARKEVGKYLKEMAADFSMGAVEVLCMLLALIWNRLYEGIEVDEEGLDRLRSAAKKAPLVIVPTHRSHVDYLVISYVFYNRGMIPPHIAAGINLSFFPLGQIFRRCGAFFIRRTFRTNPLYGLTFRYYLRKLVKEGHWIEFFPEGGRSRTGKVLPPKLGMVRELLGAVRDDVRDDLYFCPVSISYEKVVEEGAYTRELSGADKESESVGGVLRATQVLATKHGRLCLRFAEPISTRDFLDNFDGVNVKEEDREDKELKVFAYRIMKGMNDAAVVTPSALLAMVMLAHPRDGISRSQLLVRTGYLMVYLGRKGSFKSGTLRAIIDGVQDQLDSPPEAASQDLVPYGSLMTGEDLYRARILSRALESTVDETLGLMKRDHALEVIDYGDEVAYKVRPKSRITLDFYKNNIVHLVSPEGLLATALLSARGGGSIPYDALRERCLFMSKLLKLELVYEPGSSFDLVYFRTLGNFVELGWVEEADDGSFKVMDDADELIVFFANCMQPYVESYWLALTHLETLRDGPSSDKDWIKSLHKRTVRLVEDGIIRYPEASSSVTFKHALEVFAGMGLVIRYREERPSRKGKKPRSERYLRVELEQLDAIARVLPDIEHARALR